MYTSGTTPSSKTFVTVPRLWTSFPHCRPLTASLSAEMARRQPRAGTEAARCTAVLSRTLVARATLCCLFSVQPKPVGGYAPLRQSSKKKALNVWWGKPGPFFSFTRMAYP